MGFRPIGLSVLTVWASIKDQCLFKTRGLLKHGHQNTPGVYLRPGI